MARKLVLLIIAANPAQTKAIRGCVGKLSLSYHCQFVPNSLKAFDYLERKASFGNAPRPDLILLVSRLSGNHGQDVLRSIKSNPEFSRIPVIVASGQDGLTDFGKSPDRQAQPLDVDAARGFEISLGLLVEIDRFWASSTQPPQ